MKGWSKKRLIEITEKIGSGATPRGGQDAYKESGISLFRSLNVYDGFFKKKNLAFIDEDQANKLSNVVVQKGDVLLNITGASIARCCVAPSELLPARVNQHVTIIRPDLAHIDSRFLAYLLISKQYKDALLNTGEKAGSTRQALTKAQIESFEVTIPKLSEQKRIVAIVDEAFEGIDRAIANTQKNLTNARELFESYLNAIFIQKGNGWEEKKLDVICVVERGSSPRPIKQYLTESPDGVNWVKISDTQGVHKRIHSTKQKITKEGAKRSRKVEPGDFILTNSMSYGKPYIMATTGYIHDGWFVLRLANTINTDFFYYLLSSNLVQEQFKSLAAGSVVKNISSDLVKRAALPIPPLSEQTTIVDAIEELVVETQRLEGIYQRKLAALNELKQSILQKAFTGELTADTTNQAIKTTKEVIAA